MMTTPRLVSLTALAASLFIVIVTIAQSNGLAHAPQIGAANIACADVAGATGCDAAGATVQAAYLR